MTALKSLLDVVYYRVTAIDACRVTELTDDCLYLMCKSAQAQL